MIVRTEDAEIISSRPEREVRVLAQRPDISITWSRYEPGERGPDLHLHREHTDAFYVLEGELTFGLGPEGERLRVPAGGFVAAPPGLAHSFANESDAVASWLNFHAPDAGFIAYMRDLRDGRPAAFDSFDVPPDGGLPRAAAIQCGPGEGERLVYRNRVASVKAALADMSFFEFSVDGPLGGPDPHSHDDQVDSFYVLEGALEMTVDGGTHIAGPGTLASVPRHIEHSFAHRGEGSARWLNIHAPDAGFADFLRGVSG